MSKDFLKQVGAAFLVAGLALYLGACASNGPSVQEGSYVRVHYSMEADGKVVVPAERPEEMHLVVGQNAYPPAYESALIGLTVGGRKVIRLDPSEAFGSIRPELYIRIPKAQMPEGIQEGAVIGANDQDGKPLSMRVMKILEDTVVVDQNHPLAGRTLVYHVKILEIS